MAGRNAPNYGGRTGRPAGSGRKLPQGTRVELLSGGGVAPQTRQAISTVARGGNSTTNSQPRN